MNRQVTAIIAAIALTVLLTPVDISLARPPAESQVPALVQDALAPRSEAPLPPLPTQTDTLFLFPAVGPGAFGSPGTDERGWTFDGPGGEPQMAGWIGVDETAQGGDWWHLESTSVNAGTATDISAALPFDPLDEYNDYALWCGRFEDCHWDNSPGYGNRWDQYAIVNLAGHVIANQLVIRFAFVSDFEGDVWDFLQVMVEVGGEWVEVFHDATTWDRTYREEEIVLSLGDLGGLPLETRVGFRFSSDGAWSDEDGLFPTWIGAVWLDNIRVSVDGTEVFASDFESGEVPAGLTFEGAPGAGSNAALYDDLYQTDPEMQNYTHCWAFFKEGHENPDYPIPVVPYGPPYVDNVVQSPVCTVTREGEPFTWQEGDRLVIEDWTYMDIPLDALVYPTISVAPYVAEAGCLMPFEEMGSIIWPPELFGWVEDVTDMTPWLLEMAAGGTITGVALRLGVVDMCPFWCDSQGSGEGHTPSPYFDNVRIMVIRDVPVAVAEAPGGTALLGAHPNPFNPSTTIRFRLLEDERVRLTVHDIAGRNVSVLRDGSLPAGEHAAIWDGRDDRGVEMPSGVYFLDFRAGEIRESRKLVLMK